ncbi:hypothetical protein INT43_005062 [Umbelopsis isabellina]|uniref:FAD-binding domain-containing protein n=1 Tax=Mortierella isabellina TaxID=91625 RepID=A0A8H7PHD9_MORIS|nr:hypothetical protein INT43_005062 [Umbelopsis isabellina]
MNGDEVIWTTTNLEKTPSPWNNYGKVILIGDSAHSMSMARGEASNHAIRDAAELCEYLMAVNSGKLTAVQALSDYEKAMIKRGASAAKASRDAIFSRHAPGKFYSNFVMRVASTLFQTYLNVNTWINSFWTR